MITIFFAMNPRVGIISFVPRAVVVSFFVSFFLLGRGVAIVVCARDLFPLSGKTTPVRVTISWES